MKLTKEFIFYDFIYMRARVDRANLVKTKAEEYFFFCGFGGRVVREISGVIVMSSISVEIWVTQVYTFSELNELGKFRSLTSCILKIPVNKC